MSTFVGQMGVAFISLVAGWLSLWPSRHRLGALRYHLVAAPIGLLAWPLAGTFSTLTGRPLDAVAAVAGVVALAAILVAAQTVARTGTEPRAFSVSAISFAYASAALAGFGALFTRVGITAVNNDSVVSFWPLGVVLQRVGAFTDSAMAVRSPLLTGANAGHVLFGAEWGYAIYPLFALNLIAYLLMSLLSGPLAGSSRRVGTVVCVGIVAFLLTDPTFLFQAVFAHSHMITALYLLVALGELWCADPPATKPPRTTPSRAHLVIAGAAAAGVVLARPDGLAYVFVPIVLAIALLTRRPFDARSNAAFFGPLLSIALLPFAAGYLTLGLWGGGKLTGKRALVMLVPFALSAAGPWAVGKLDAMIAPRISGDRFARIAVAGGLALLALAHVASWSTAKASAMNAATNLFGGAGGYAHIWYAVAILLVASLVTKDALRQDSWTQPAFLAIVLYGITLALVHGIAHPGRIGAGDTLTRMTFQAIPLVVWYAAAIAARIMAPDAVARDRVEAPTSAG